MNYDIKVPAGYNVILDTIYGFNYAIYPNNSQHKHSIALLQRINQNNKMSDI